MELNLGGPVWHASVMSSSAVHGRAYLVALKALEGVGDPARGEWLEQGNSGVFHIRRRLTPAECVLGGGLVMRDIRGSDEARKRLLVVAREVPHIVKLMPALLAAVQGRR